MVILTYFEMEVMRASLLTLPVFFYQCSWHPLLLVRSWLFKMLVYFYIYTFVNNLFVKINPLYKKIKYLGILIQEYRMPMNSEGVILSCTDI